MRYPVMNLSTRRLSGAATSVEESNSALCSIAKTFQDAVDRPGKATARDLDSSKDSFNQYMDNVIKQGGDPIKTFDNLRNNCGIRYGILKWLRPNLFINDVTGAALYWGSPKASTPPATPTPVTTSKPAPPPPAQPPAPVSTPGGSGGPVMPPSSGPIPVSNPGGSGSPATLTPIPTTLTPVTKPTPPPVATGAVGCWYVIGEGYSWGPRPTSGESTGLNQSDCNSIISRDREVRGIPQMPEKSGPQQPEVQPSSPSTYGMLPPTHQQPPSRPAVPTGGSGGCVPPAFWDGTKCRGSVSSVPTGASGGAGGAGATVQPELNPGAPVDTGGGLLMGRAFMGQVRLRNPLPSMGPRLVRIMR